MKRRRHIKWSKTFLIFSAFTILTPLIANAIPDQVKAVFGNSKEEIKLEQKQNVKVSQKTEAKKTQLTSTKKTAPITKPPVEKPSLQPTPYLTPIIPIQDAKVKPKPSTSTSFPGLAIDRAITCSINNNRPPNSKWIYKNKIVGAGVRYTSDIFVLNNVSNNQTKIYYYILHDKITQSSKPKVVGNFSIAYQKQIPNILIPIDKQWEVEFNGCGLETKDDQSIPMVSIFDNDQMLKSMKLTGFQLIEKVGMVQKPTTYIRVLNQLDLTETK
jgi:hypothetical protein